MPEPSSRLKQHWTYRNRNRDVRVSRVLRRSRLMSVISKLSSSRRKDPRSNNASSTRETRWHDRAPVIIILAALGARHYRGIVCSALVPTSARVRVWRILRWRELVTQHQSTSPDVMFGIACRNMLHSIQATDHHRSTIESSYYEYLPGGGVRAVMASDARNQCDQRLGPYVANQLDAT